VNSRQREGATNLSREIIEAARAIDYDQLTPSRATAAIQAQPNLGDADAGTAGWQVIRRGTTYTVNKFDGSGNLLDDDSHGTPCAWDDPRDGARSADDHSLDAVLCSSLASAVPALDPATNTNCGVPLVPPCIDANPDDYRRLAVDVSWTRGSVTRTANQQGIIVNPAGGLGPRITSVTPASTTVNEQTPSVNQVTFSVVTGASAVEVDWSADDAKQSKGVATLTAGSSPPAWTFNWNLSPVGDPNAVLDGTYTLSIQAFDSLGAPGDLKTATVTLNRSAPVAPATPTGGRDDRGGTMSPPEVVDVTWPANKERDIIGYHVYRTDPTAADQLVCDTLTFQVTTQNFCTDTNSNAGTAALANGTQYYVKAVDRDSAGNPREGAASAAFSVPSVDPAPTWPGGTTLTATTTNGLPTLTWSNQANASGAPLFYRIYRDGTALTDRYDVTGNGTQLTYTDTRPGSTTAHTYYVTAVSQNYEEGPFLGPATSP
jgi:hypothetical protein